MSSVILKPLHAFVNYVMHKILGGLLQPPLPKVEFSIKQNKLELRDIELNPKSTSLLLGISPIHVYKAFVKKVTISTKSITKILREKIVVDIQDVHIVLGPSYCSGFGFQTKKESSKIKLQESTQEGSTALQGIIDKILSNIQIQITNIQVRVLQAGLNIEQPTLVLNINLIEFQDKSTLQNEIIKESEIKGIQIHLIKNSLDYMSLEHIDESLPSCIFYSGYANP